MLATSHYFDSGHVAYGFLYSGTGYTTFYDPLGVQGTFATGINDAGQIVGFYRGSNGLFHGFLLSGGTFTTLDDPSATIIDDPAAASGTPLHRASTMRGRSSGFTRTAAAGTTASSSLLRQTRRRPPAPPPT